MKRLMLRIRIWLRGRRKSRDEPGMNGNFELRRVGDLEGKETSNMGSPMKQEHCSHLQVSLNGHSSIRGICLHCDIFDIDKAFRWDSKEAQI